MHGNAVAFRAALADVERHDVDLIVALGDVAQGGPQPKECVDLLRELDCPCVSGNSDEFLLTLDLGAEPVEDAERKQRLLETADWSREQLGEEGLDFLRGFSRRCRPATCSAATRRPRRTRTALGSSTRRKQPLDRVPFLPWSEYAIVSDELEVAFRRIPFDVGKLIDVAKAADFPDFEHWAAMWQR
jgi:hypothetical protein